MVARARTGAEALRLADRLQPDVVLADIEMPQMTGLELAPKLVKRGMHVITLTTFARPGYLRRALDAGVHGYPAQGHAGRRARAGGVRQSRAGRRAIAPELAVEAWCEADPLTDIERQVLRLSRLDDALGELLMVLVGPLSPFALTTAPRSSLVVVKVHLPGGEHLQRPCLGGASRANGSSISSAT